jgi:hypothetical protein
MMATAARKRGRRAPKDRLHEIRVRTVSLLGGWLKMEEMPKPNHSGGLNLLADFLARLSDDALLRRAFLL